MPDRETIEKAQRDLKEGKSPTTAAGEFVHQEIEYERRGKHRAHSPQQAIAIGLSEARRAGIPLRPPAKRKSRTATRKKAERDYARGQTSPGHAEEGSSPRGRSRMKALKKEPQNTVSHSALSSQAKGAAKRRKSA